MKTTLFDINGKELDALDLPAVFETPYRPDLIRRAVLASQANRKQDYGPDAFAGFRTSAESPGSGRGLAHVPRSNNRGRRVPQAVRGRRAHPPKPEADRSQKINDNERRQAIRSAVAATADSELVSARGHSFDTSLTLPIVVEDDFESLTKTRDVVDLLESVGVYSDIERADQKTVRGGRGTTRGRKYTRPRSILFITGSEPSVAARNLAGADVATAKEVNAEDLAPGTHPGRLSVWTETAIQEVGNR
jgi:large subunit ribosomal protein L4e